MHFMKAKCLRVFSSNSVYTVDSFEMLQDTQLVNIVGWKMRISRESTVYSEFLW
jgi:hypothetical protein